MSIPRRRLPMNQLHTCLNRWAANGFLTIAWLCIPTVLLGQGETISSPQPIEALIKANTSALLKVETAKLKLPSGSLSQDSDLAARHAQAVQWLSKLSNQQNVYATIQLPFSPAQTPVHLFVHDQGEKTRETLRSQLTDDQFKNLVTQGGFVGFALSQKLQVASKTNLSISASENERSVFSRALGVVAQYPVALAIVTPSYIKRTIQELVPELPPQLGGGPSSVITQGIEWIAIGMDPGAAKAHVIVQAQSESAAKALATALPSLSEKGMALIPGDWPAMAKETLSFIRDVPISVEGSQMHLRLEGVNTNKVSGILKQTLEWMLGANSQRNAMDRFKQIALGMHNFVDANGAMPPGKNGFDANGKQRLSWRVHILPYIEQHALYSQFKLDEPWDSPHNKSLLPKMPNIYSSSNASIPFGNGTHDGKTTVQAPVGKGTIYGQAKATTFHNIEDGSSNTAWIVEVKPERAVPWTSPQDYEFDVADPAKGLQVTEDGKVVVGIADGSVIRMSTSITPQMLLNLFQMADGNVVELP
jgi:Protein of unknown function (DUF1559)